jgi:hypothetical protein
MLLPSVTAPDFCSVAGSEGVAVHTVVSLNSSADESVLLPVDEPPTTRTFPFRTIDVGRTTML